MKSRNFFIIILILVMASMITPLNNVWGWEIVGLPPYYGYPNSGSYAYPPYRYSYYPYPYWAPPPGSYYPPPDQPFFGGQLVQAGRLIMVVDPVSAEVYVDGLRLVQHDDLSYEIGLLVGRHQVTVKKDGYESYDKGVDIPGGQHLFLTVRLNPGK